MSFVTQVFYQGMKLKIPGVGFPGGQLDERAERMLTRVSLPPGQLSGSIFLHGNPFLKASPLMVTKWVEQSLTWLSLSVKCLRKRQGQLPTSLKLGFQS